MSEMEQEGWETIRRWRSSAEECRATAAQTKSPEARRNLLDMAVVYDAMADRAEARLRERTRSEC